MNAVIPVPLRDFIDARIAEGFDAPDDVIQGVADFFDGSDEVDLEAITPEAIHAAVEESLAAHLEAQRAWPVPTDCDRLDRAFARLERAGVVARQNWACCQNCGHSEIGEEVASAKVRGQAVKGYTFFHQQDTERAAAGGGIGLAFGLAHKGSDQELEALGAVIRDAVVAEGLEVSWNGSATQRLHVSLDWKKRR